jgi:hypothetical protein
MNFETFVFVVSVFSLGFFSGAIAIVYYTHRKYFLTPIGK